MDDENHELDKETREKTSQPEKKQKKKTGGEGDRQ